MSERQIAPLLSNIQAAMLTMAANVQTGILAVNGSIKQIGGVIEKTSVEIRNEIRTATSYFVKASLIAKRVGNTALGQEMGVTKQSDIIPALNKVFAPLIIAIQDIPASLNFLPLKVPSGAAAPADSPAQPAGPQYNTNFKEIFQDLRAQMKDLPGPLKAFKNLLTSIKPTLPALGPVGGLAPMGAGKGTGMAAPLGGGQINLKGTFTKLSASLKTAVATVKTKVQALNVKDLFSTMGSSLKASFAGVKTKVQSLNVKDAFTKVGSSLKAGFATVKTKVQALNVKDLFSTMGSSLKASFAGVKTKVQSLNVKDAFTKVGSSLKASFAGVKTKVQSLNVKDAFTKVGSSLKAGFSKLRKNLFSIDPSSFDSSRGVGESSPNLITATARPQEPQTGLNLRPLKNALGSTFKKMGSGITNTFKGVGSSLLSAFGPMTILFQILSPLISAFLEPLDMLSPLLESWGTILSQLLYPIIKVLLEIFIPLTPAIMSIVDALMPLVELLATFLTPLIPLATMIANVIVMIMSLVQVVTTLFGVIGIGPEMLTVILSFVSGFIATITGRVTEFVGGISSKIATIIGDVKDYFTGLLTTIIDTVVSIVESVKGFFTGIKDAFTDGTLSLKQKFNSIKTAFTDAWDDIVESITAFIDKVIDKFNVFDGGGFDDNPDTWW